METTWKTRTKYVDIETGEILSIIDTINYIITKTTKHATVQNGHGTIEYTNECRRVYERDLFGGEDGTREVGK